MVNGICGEIGNTVESLVKEINEMIVEPLMKEDEKRIVAFVSPKEIESIVMVSDYDTIGVLLLNNLKIEKRSEVLVCVGWWIEFSRIENDDFEDDLPCLVVTDGVVRNYFIVSFSL